MKSVRSGARLVVVGGVLGLLLMGFGALGTMAQDMPAGAPPAGKGPGGPMGPGGMMGPGGPPPQITLGETHYDGGVTGVLDIPYNESRGTRPVQLDLYYAPANHALKPAVIWIHGGAFSGGNSRMSLSSFGPFDKVLAGIAARGYVAVGVNYRLSGEATFPAAVQDIKAAVQWLRANASKYDVDPNRIALWGESAGAYLAVETGTTCGVKELEATGQNSNQSSCVQAVIDWYGPIDFPKIAEMQKASVAKAQGAGGNMPPMMGGPGGMPPMGAGPGSMPPMMGRIGKTPEVAFLGCDYAACSPELLARANPITFISASTPPFLIMHGDADSAVPYKQSQELYDALKAKSVSAQFKLLPGLNHMFGGANADQTKEILKTVSDFLDTSFHVNQNNTNN